jgi:olefin beta-lactone synthetase
MANVVELFLAQARHSPGAIALIDRAGGRDRLTTYGDLADQSARIATLLAERGVGAGSPVLLLHPPTAELYAVVIAIFRLGAIAMVVDPSAGRATLAAACDELPPTALFASGRGMLLALVSAPLRRIVVKLTSARVALGATRLRTAASLVPLEKLARVDGDAPALVTYTSGSTGLAKGAVRTHGVLAAQHAALGSVAARAGEIDLVSLPIVVLTNLGAGATSVIPDGPLHRPGSIDPGPVLGQLERHRVQRVTASPALVERIVDGALDARSGALRGVRIVTGGGPVFPDLVARAASLTGARLIAVYGSTEAEPIAHIASGEIGEPELAAMRAGGGLIAGRPVAEVDVRIVPRHAASASEIERVLRAATRRDTNTRGEIIVNGRHVVPGYLHGRGDSETKIHLGGTVWHRTGDAGYIDDRGRLWLLGRVAAAITDSRGELHPFAVECAARLLLPARRTVLAGHQGQRILLVEGRLTVRDREELANGLRWAQLDRIIDRVTIPLDRRHNSKVDYAALGSRLERLVPAPGAER